MSISVPKGTPPDLVAGHALRSANNKLGCEARGVYDFDGQEKATGALRVAYLTTPFFGRYFNVNSNKCRNKKQDNPKYIK